MKGNVKLLSDRLGETRYEQYFRFIELIRKIIVQSEETVFLKVVTLRKIFV